MPRGEVIRMGPVGAPDNAVRRRGDDRSGEGDHFDEGKAEIGMHIRVTDFVRAAHFYPDMLLFHEIEKQLKGWLAQTCDGLDPGDVVDDHWNRHGANALFLFEELFRVDVEVHRPSELGDMFHAAI